MIWDLRFKKINLWIPHQVDGLAPLVLFGKSCRMLYNTVNVFF